MIISANPHQTVLTVFFIGVRTFQQCFFISVRTLPTHIQKSVRTAVLTVF